MGNSPSGSPKSKELKSFKDITSDLKNLNDIFSNKNFVLEFGCKLRVRIKNPSQKLLATIKYQFSKEADFELEIKKIGKSETVILSLKEFYDFYDRVITYSILSLNSENAKKTEVSPGEDTNEETTRKSSIKDDENLCAICFEKPFDVILPCLHSFCDDCCTMWYGGKNKTECPMCRTTIDGDWQEKSFSVVNKSDQGNAARGEVVKFVNKKALFMRIR